MIGKYRQRTAENEKAAGGTRNAHPTWAYDKLRLLTELLDDLNVGGLQAFLSGLNVK